MAANPVWKAINAFSLTAVKAVLGAKIDLHLKEKGGVSYIVGRDADLQVLITDEQLQAIALASTLSYWTDGRHVWWGEAPRPQDRSMQELSAAEALARFGIDALYEAYEKGSSGWN